MAVGFGLKWFIKTLDVLFTMCLLTPLVAMYWRGTFSLLDIYLIPQNKAASYAVSLAMGIPMLIVFIYISPWIKDFAGRTKSPISEIFIKRLYAEIYGFFAVCHWRGIWYFWDLYTGYGLMSGIISCFVGLGIIFFCRTLRNCICPPVVVASDLNDGFFDISTRFRMTRDRPILFFLDCVFTICIPHSAMVCYVRGSWYMVSAGLAFPSIIAKGWQSYGISGIIGFAMVFMILLLQRPWAMVSIKLERNKSRWVNWWLRILWEDVFMFLASLAGMNVWRFSWSFLDKYMFPISVEISAWMCHIIGMGGLMFFYHGATALVKGIEVDGELKNGEGCYLPCSTFTLFQADMGQTHRKLHVEAEVVHHEEKHDVEMASSGNGFNHGNFNNNGLQMGSVSMVDADKVMNNQNGNGVMNNHNGNGVDTNRMAKVR